MTRSQEFNDHPPGAMRFPTLFGWFVAYPISTLKSVSRTARDRGMHSWDVLLVIAGGTA